MKVLHDVKGFWCDREWRGLTYQDRILWVTVSTLAMQGIILVILLTKEAK